MADYQLFYPYLIYTASCNYNRFSKISLDLLFWSRCRAVTALGLSVNTSLAMLTNVFLAFREYLDGRNSLDRGKKTLSKQLVIMAICPIGWKVCISLSVRKRILEASKHETRGMQIKAHSSMAMEADDTKYLFKLELMHADPRSPVIPWMSSLLWSLLYSVQNPDHGYLPSKHIVLWLWPGIDYEISRTPRLVTACQ